LALPEKQAGQDRRDHHPSAAWSIDAIDNRTIDDESHGPEFFVIEAGEEPSCLEVCDLNGVG
jgi:hypothetical protein